MHKVLADIVLAELVNPRAKARNIYVYGRVLPSKYRIRASNGF